MVGFDRRPEEGRHGIRTTVGLRWAAPIARDPVQLSPGPPATEQGLAVSAGPADRGGDNRRDASGRRRPDGIRLRGVIIVLWRAGFRISEALALTETDLDRQRGAVLIRIY